MNPTVDFRQPTIRPYGPRVLCRIARHPNRTKGGIFLVEEKLTGEAEIVAIGDGFELPLKVGDRVAFKVHGGINVTDPGNHVDYTLFTKDELVAVIEP